MDMKINKTSKPKSKDRVLRRLGEVAMRLRRPCLTLLLITMWWHQQHLNCCLWTLPFTSWKCPQGADWISSNSAGETEIWNMLSEEGDWGMLEAPNTNATNNNHSSPKSPGRQCKWKQRNAANFWILFFLSWWWTSSHHASVLCWQLFFFFPQDDICCERQWATTLEKMKAGVSIFQNLFWNVWFLLCTLHLHSSAIGTHHSLAALQMKKVEPHEISVVFVFVCILHCWMSWSVPTNLPPQAWWAGKCSPKLKFGPFAITSACW